MARQALAFTTLAAGALLGTLVNAGCVRRVIDVTSDPPGATLWLNDREIGRTPCQAEFTYYGTYDVRLALDGFEPLDTHAEATAPAWDVIGADLVSEALPAKLTSVNAWHFTLVPTSTDHAALLERAKAMREATLPPPSDPAPAGDPPAGPQDPPAQSTGG